MNPRDWFLTFHLIGVVLYAGGLIIMTRVIYRNAQEPEDIQRVTLPQAKRIYINVIHPGLALTLVFGLLLFFRVGEAAGGPLDYLKPYTEDRLTRTLWYSTFHAKFVLLAILATLDVMTLRRLSRSVRDGRVRRPAFFKRMHIAIVAIVVLIVVLMKAGPLKGPNIDSLVGKPSASSHQQ